MAFAVTKNRMTQDFDTATKLSRIVDGREPAE
jgi:hypothetical protein